MQRSFQARRLFPILCSTREGQHARLALRLPAPHLVGASRRLEPQTPAQALWTRARLEAENTRAAHRSLEQMAQLSRGIEGQALPDSGPGATAAERSRFQWAVGNPPMWDADRELADLNLKLGLTRDAAALYEKWEDWDMMITCYQLMDADMKVIRSLPFSTWHAHTRCVAVEAR